MADGEVIVYSTASIICALFLLEFGADKFIDNTVVVASRTGVPPGLIALLTAGAEWEELAVVVISIARNRSSLAVGNIVGSTISNILGAFSLGLLFHRTNDHVCFDKTSKIYSALLLAVTVLIAGLTAFGQHTMLKAVGSFAITLFVLYISSISWSIYHGYVSPPEIEDSDSGHSEHEAEPRARPRPRPSADRTQPIQVLPQDRIEEDNEPSEPHATGPSARVPPSPTDQQDHVAVPDCTNISNDVPLRSLPLSAANSVASSGRSTQRHRSLIHHIALLVIGMVAIVISAYVLSYAATNIVDQFGISDVAVGIVILSIITTIPEKFIAVIGGRRGAWDITVATTVGSNIFLLTLCMGILWVTTGGDYNQGFVTPAETGVMLGSAIVMTLIVCFGAKWPRLIGAVLLMAYIAFLVLEFTVIHPQSSYELLG